MEHIIYLVEDDADVRSSYEYLLKSVGNVVSFASPAQFLKHLDSDPCDKPDLVVTDLSMPKMTGVEMIMAAASKGYRFSSILVSGHVNKDSAIKAVNNGICKILEKPVDSDTLIAMAKQVLMTGELAKLRHEIMQRVTQIQELFKMFQEICVNELELRGISDGEAVIDLEMGSKSSITSAIREVEEHLDKLRDCELTLDKLVNIQTKPNVA